ncbi:class I SAM-dependent methyltransferase [Alkalimarinus coralli]|uniref:class I SAM-dependent methyltransferase n=1 Tax=Alkalimarinus coralli TaxID=2935863 RepID=UPI00202B5B7D|nr:class I SAM-dependent methyltransferase [Alkalimarinus coralli]
MSRITECRICGGSDIKPVLDLGHTPLADRLVKPSQLSEKDPVFPLEVGFCPNCSLLQIMETVPPSVLFCEDYPYYSSFSEHLLKHSKENVEAIIAERGLGSESLAVELASNDGYLLKNYVNHGIQVLGIDPAEGPAREAEKIGVETLNDFFSKALSTRLVAEGKKADVIHANNVLAHVADLNNFVAGIAQLLKDNGVAVIEAPYVKDLVDHCEFDTMYHEHLCYFSVTALNHLFSQHHLSLNRVVRLSIHGGSLRLFVGKQKEVESSVTELLELEHRSGVDQIGYYQDFSKRVNHVVESLNALLHKLKSGGSSIAAYGAAAKGSTLINTAKIGTDLIDFVVDKNTHKQGLYMPGQHIPIYAPEALLEKMPDYTLILPWNFTDEILSQQREYTEKGGKFIVPIPEPKII